jgi:hypothetical protein
MWIPPLSYFLLPLSLSSRRLSRLRLLGWGEEEVYGALSNQHSAYGPRGSRASKCTRDGRIEFMVDSRLSGELMPSGG